MEPRKLEEKGERRGTGAGRAVGQAEGERSWVAHAQERRGQVGALPLAVRQTEHKDVVQREAREAREAMMTELALGKQSAWNPYIPYPTSPGAVSEWVLEGGKVLSGVSMYLDGAWNINCWPKSGEPFTTASGIDVTSRLAWIINLTVDNPLQMDRVRCPHA